jgi:hypothetical protein
MMDNIIEEEKVNINPRIKLENIVIIVIASIIISIPIIGEFSRFFVYQLGFSFYGLTGGIKPSLIFIVVAKLINRFKHKKIDKYHSLILNILYYIVAVAFWFFVFVFLLNTFLVVA